MNRTDPPTRLSRIKAVLRAPWVLWVVLLLLVLAVVVAVLLWVVIVTPVPAGLGPYGWSRGLANKEIPDRLLVLNLAHKKTNGDIKTLEDR